jgi:AraC family L-rhamnose operon regulatory protein RhaS
MFRGSDGTFHDDPTAPLRRARARGDIGLWAWGRGSYPGAQLGDDDLPGLASAGMWEVEADQDWGLDWHLNEGVEVTFATRGRLAFATEAQHHDLQRGWVSVTRPWQRHRLGMPNVTACTLGWFVIDVGALRPNQPWRWPGWIPLPESHLARLTQRLRGNERSVWRATPELMAAADRLERVMREEHGSRVARLGLGVAEVLLELADILDGDEPDDDPYFSSAERTVQVFLQNIRTRLDEPWTVSAMAAACGLGRTRFIHYCRQVVNASPLDYLNGLRIDRAAELLTTTDLTVADIAYSCGFSSSQYFATVFKHHFGRSPTSARSAAASSRTDRGAP